MYPDSWRINFFACTARYFISVTEACGVGKKQKNKASNEPVSTSPETIDGSFFRPIRRQATPAPTKKLADFSLSTLKKMARTCGRDNFRAWAAMSKAGLGYDLDASVEYARHLKNLRREKAKITQQTKAYELSGVDRLLPADYPVEFIVGEDGSLAEGFAYDAGGKIIHIRTGRSID